ncbi:MAG: hypothetical protein EB157_04475 [Euryarchaeota archaeon]|nr:hypothetical protein [Euryarchaeota archaeon]
MSGKDSMKNDATLHGEKISIPPTILFSLIGNHSDVRKAVSSDFKSVGDRIYLCGESHHELGASELSYMLRDESNGKSGIGGRVPQIDPNRNLAMYRALTNAMEHNLVASAHDCSDGGLVVSLAECCFGSNSGAEVDISSIMSDCDQIDAWGALFGESLGRILVSVKLDDCEAFEANMAGHACYDLGHVVDGDKILISNGADSLISSSMSELRGAWKGTLDGGGPQ